MRLMASSMYLAWTLEVDPEGRKRNYALVNGASGGRFAPAFVGVGIDLVGVD